MAVDVEGDVEVDGETSGNDGDTVVAGDAMVLVPVGTLLLAAVDTGVDEGFTDKEDVT